MKQHKRQKTETIININTTQTHTHKLYRRTTKNTQKHKTITCKTEHGKLQNHKTTKHIKKNIKKNNKKKQ